MSHECRVTIEKAVDYREKPCGFKGNRVSEKRRKLVRNFVNAYKKLYFGIVVSAPEMSGCTKKGGEEKEK